MIDVLQETLCDHFSDDTLTACCFLTKAINRKIAYYWFKRFAIVPENAPLVLYPGLRIRAHKSYAVMSLCPFFTDYQPIRSLFCTLSESTDTAASELESIGHFTNLHPIKSLILYIRGDYLSDIEPLLWLHCRCPDITIIGDVSLRNERKFRPHHFKGQSWDHITSLSASSPAMFTTYGRRITLDLITARHLQELRLTDSSMSGKTWSRFLARMSIPDLTVFEIDGNVSLKVVCSFLARHTGVDNLILGTSILSRSCHSEIAVLPRLMYLQAPVRLALPFLRVNTALTRLTLLRDSQSTTKDFREVLLSLVGTSVYSLTLPVDAESMQELGALHIPTCLRFVQTLSLNVTDVFSPPMLVSRILYYVPCGELFSSKLADFHQTTGCLTTSPSPSLSYGAERNRAS